MCRGIEINLILEWGSKLTDFIDGVEVNLVFVCGIEFDLVLVWVSKLNCFLFGVKIDFVFVCGPILLGFDVWIEIDMVFVCGPQKT